MAELRDLISGLGCTAVRSYIASGNVLLRTSRGPAIAREIEAAIADRYGYQVPVMLRSIAELQAIERANPFTEVDGARYVGLCSEAPAAAAVARLQPWCSPDDRAAVVGREVFFAYANGRGNSRLTPDRVEAALQLPVTVRNWRTLAKVLALASG